MAHSFGFRFAAFCRRAWLVALALYLAGLPLSSQAPTASSPEPAETSSEESAIYTALLKELYNPAIERPLFIADETAIGVPPGLVTKVDVKDEQTARFISRLSPEARQDYTDRNKSHARLPSPCRLVPECVVADLADLAEKVKSDKAWRNFFKKYPNSPGIIIVSRVGFNRDRTEAIVYTGRACGSMCGEGEYARLVKTGDNWVVDDHAVIWLSQK